MKAKYLLLITTIIGIFVTYYNIQITKLDNEKILQLAKIHEDRDWKYKLTDFMGKHMDDIFSEDLRTRENIRKIMMVSFSTDITSKIFSNMAKVSIHKNEWLKAQNILKRINQPTVYMQIVKGFPEKILEPIADTIACGDISYVTNDEYVDSNLTNGDVRYFVNEDKTLAQQVLNDFVSMACGEGYALKLKLLPLTKNKDRNIKGTIEVWLSPKNVHLVTDKKNECYYEEVNI